MNWKYLYDPLSVFGKSRGLLIGTLVVVVLTLVAWWAGVHLDGALDLHINPKFPSILIVAMESLVDWLSLALVFFIGSKILRGNGGLGAHLAGVGLARFPYILASIIASRQLLGKAMLAAVTIKPDTITVRPQDLLSPGLIIGSIVLMLMMIWSVAILYFGFKEASRLRGAKLVISFIIGIIIAEVISKAVIYGMIKMDF